MSLTKRDLQLIAEVVEEKMESQFEKYFDKYFERYFSKHFVIAFEKVIVPYVDAKVDELRQEMNSHVLSLHGRCDETIALIGHYFEQCVPHSEFEKLKYRVKRLEYSTI